MSSHKTKIWNQVWSDSSLKVGVAVRNIVDDNLWWVVGESININICELVRHEIIKKYSVS